MSRQLVTIKNKLGLHTRAAAKLVDTAKRFQSKIELIHRDRVADCKSIMGIILLGAPQGTTFELVVSGEDEQQAAEAIVALINNRFNEAE